jgi:chromosome segregation ATPase
MRKRSLWAMALVMVCLFLVASCSRDKEPAELAIKGVEEALNAAKGEIAKYVPDQLKSLEAAVKGAKEKFEKKEYTEALNAAKDLPGKVKEAVAAAAAKKAELTKGWEALSAELPKMMEEIKAKVEALGKAKKLPAGVDKAKLEGAKAGVGELTQGWADAENAFKGGNLSDALAKANELKGKAGALMAALEPVK